MSISEEELVIFLCRPSSFFITLPCHEFHDETVFISIGEVRKGTYEHLVRN